MLPEADLPPSPEQIWAKYHSAYQGELQGCCLLIADEIVRAGGGQVVAGWLTWYGGACKRMHWWVERDGAVIDPMGDHVLSGEVAPGRIVEHRDRKVFDALLVDYERWRIKPIYDHPAERRSLQEWCEAEDLEEAVARGRLSPRDVRAR